MPSMDYLLGEIAVDGSDQRAEAVTFNEMGGKKFEWPEGWWAVSDDEFAYLGFFQFEEDAWAYRLYLINLRMDARRGAARYEKVDKRVDAEEARMLAKMASKKTKKAKK